MWKENMISCIFQVIVVIYGVCKQFSLKMEEIGDFKVIYPQIPKNDHFYPLGVEIRPLP